MPSNNLLEVHELAGAYKALAQAKKKAETARQKRLSGVQTKVIVGTATCGVSAGARIVVDALNDEIRLRGLKHVAVTETGCSGRCDLEPLVQVLKEGEAPVMYYFVTEDKARRIIQQHVQNNDVIKEWTLT